MTPLIDVVFLLLTFFVLAIVMMVRADVLDVSLPSIAAGTQADNSPTVTISLDADGNVFVNGEPTTDDELVATVISAQEAKPDSQLLVAVDERGRSGRVIEVFDKLAQGGLTGFGVIGTPAPSDAPAGDGGGASQGESDP